MVGIIGKGHFEPQLESSGEWPDPEVHGELPLLSSLRRHAH